MISGYFRHQKFRLSRQPQEVKPPTQRLWAARRQRPMCQQDVWGFPELDNSLWFHFSGAISWKFDFFWRKERKHFLQFCHYIEIRRIFLGGAPKAAPRRRREGGPGRYFRRVWLIHSPFHICFTNFVGALKNISWNFQGFLGKALVFVHAGENVEAPMWVSHLKHCPPGDRRAAAAPESAEYCGATVEASLDWVQHLRKADGRSIKRTLFTAILLLE